MSESVSDIISRVVKSSDSGDSVYPPVRIAGSAVGSVVISVAFIFVSPSWLNWIGYVFGTFVTTVVVLVYRHRTLKASTHPRFVRRENWNRVAAVALLLGMIAGAYNVYWALTEVRIK